MAENIVAGLFGPQPWQIEQAQQQAFDTTADRYAQMTPFQQASGMLFRGGGGLARGGAQMAGWQTPQMVEAQRTQQIMSQIDTTTAEGLAKGAMLANQAGNPKLAFMLAQAAQKRKQEEADLKLKEAHARYYDLPKQGNSSARLAEKQAIARREALRRGYAAGLSGKELEEYAQQQVDILTRDWNATTGGGKASAIASDSVRGDVPISDDTSLVSTDPRFSAEDIATMRADAMKRGDSAAVAALDKLAPAVQLKPKTDVIRDETTARTRARIEAEKPSDIDPKVVDYYAEQSLSGDHQWQIGLARGKNGQALIQAVKDRIPEMAAERGESPQEPAANKAERASIAKAMAQVQSRVAGIELGSNKIEKDIKVMENAAKSGNLDLPQIASKPLNWARTQTGSPALKAYALAVKQVATEYERLMTGGMLSVAQLHVGAQEDAKKILNEDMTIAEVQAIIPIMLAEIDNGKTAGIEEIGKLRGQIANVGKKKAAPRKDFTGFSIVK